jgi:hypothetical protein
MSAALAEPLTIELDAERQFDFWLGEWDCSWTDGDRRCVASNSVYVDLGGKVVVESFDGRPSLDFQGMSFSVYDRAAHCWKQTWVDSEGAYLDFTGGYENGAMELRRTGDVEGHPALFRMRWDNIRQDSLDWSWQRSVDGGEAWSTLWELEYTRVL